MSKARIIQGDALETLKTLPDESVNTCVTSPPYYALRDYGIDGQIGLEQTPDEYIQKLVDVFSEVRRVLRNDGTLWVNIGDSYWGSGSRGYDFTGKFAEASAVQAGSKGTINLSNLPSLTGNTGTYKNKDLIGIPWMLAFALRADGWYLRQDIIWHKPNPMPESVKDRCTKAHEYIFLLSKRPKYYFDHEAMKEVAKETRVVERKDNPPRYGGKKYTENPDRFYRTKSGNAYAYSGYRNKRDVWSVTVKAYKGAHFATFPEDLITPCVLTGALRGGVVLDPFNGSGTTGVVCVKNGREYIGIELNPEYVEMSKRRISDAQERIERESAQYAIAGV